MTSPYPAALLIIAAIILFINRDIVTLVRQHRRSAEHVADGIVTHVIDGDTIRVSIDGCVETIRYIGINAPEVGERGHSQATEANRSLVDGKRVRMESDKQDVDRYGRKLRYVWVGKRFINRELYRQGAARIMVVKPNTKRIAEIIS